MFRTRSAEAARISAVHAVIEGMPHPDWFKDFRDEAAPQPVNHSEIIGEAVLATQAEFTTSDVLLLSA